MTWTLREDAALLSTKAKQRVLLTPALQQSQWQDVAFDVTEAADAAVRSADECAERYQALLEMAKSTAKSQWPGDEKLHELIQAALERESVSGGRGPTTENQRPANGQMPVVAVGGSNTTVGQVATSKRRREDQAPRELTLEHDEIILRVVVETIWTREPYLWRKTAKRVKSDTRIDVRATVLKARYHELLEMSDDAIQARFQGSERLYQLFNRGRALYERGLQLYGRERVVTTSTRPLIAKSPPVQARHGSALGCRDGAPHAVARLQTAPSPQAPVRGSMKIQEVARANESSQLELSTPHNSSETTQPTRQPSEESRSLPGRKVESQLNPRGQSEPADRTPQEDIAELKKTVTLMTSTLTLVYANVTQMMLENSQLKKDVATLRVELDQAKLAPATTEMAALRAKLEQAERDIMALHEVKATSVASKRCEWVEYQTEQQANTNALNELSTKYRDNVTAERQRHAILSENIQTEMLKREELAKRLEKQHAMHERTQQDVASLVEKLRDKYEKGQQAQEESMIWFHEDIQQEVANLREEHKREVIKYDQLLSGMQDELTMGLAGVHTATSRHQDEAKRQSLDQYVHTTLQLHERKKRD